MSKVKITQIGSTIGHKQKDRDILKVLGLRKIHQSVVRELTPSVEGMIKSVSHLVKTEKVEG